MTHLLFTAGLLVATGFIDTNIAVVCLLITIAAVAGNITGYWIGNKAGPSIFRRPTPGSSGRSTSSERSTSSTSTAARAIVLARFIPIVRTFITVMAGAANMNFRSYVLYSTIGGILWGTGVTLLGYFLGNIEFVRENIELIIVGMVALSVIPDLLRTTTTPAYRSRNGLIQVLRQNRTSGAARTVGSSASKYSASLKPNMRATMFGGKVCTLVFMRSYIRVVEATPSRNAVLSLGELTLQIEEVGVGLEIWVGLCNGEELTKRAREDVLLSSLLGRRCTRGGRLGTRRRNGFECLALMTRVSLYRLDKVGNQVVPTVQLDVDLLPRLFDDVAKLDEAVVLSDNPQSNNDDQSADNDENPNHNRLLADQARMANDHCDRSPVHLPIRGPTDRLVKTKVG